MMKKTWFLNAMACSVLFTAMAFHAPKASADAASDLKVRNDVIGCWKTIDDKTKSPKSLVKISKKGASLSGRILRLFRKPSEEQKPKCDKCKGDKKGKPVIGMEIIWNMKATDYWWKDGKILDPANGKVYRAELWLDRSGKNRNLLQVRGFVAFFYRTQKWHRTACPGKAAAAPAKAAPAPARR